MEVQETIEVLDTLVQEMTEGQDTEVQEMIEVQDIVVKEMIEAQDTEVHEMIEVQDIVVKEMIEVQDTIEILEVGALDLTEMIEVLDLIEVLKIIDAEKHSKQLVVIVETNVKYHSNQNMTDLFIAKNVSKITNHKNVAVALDSIEEQAIVEMSEAQDTIKVNLDSKETVLQFTVEIILEQQNIRQIVMNPMEKIIGNTILIILIHFILQ